MKMLELVIEHVDPAAVSDLKVELLRHITTLHFAKPHTLYDEIDSIMTDIANRYSITGHQLHNGWMDKFKQTPDSWIQSKAALEPDEVVDEDWRSKLAAGAMAMGALGGAHGYTAANVQHADQNDPMAALVQQKEVEHQDKLNAIDREKIHDILQRMQSDKAAELAAAQQDKKMAVAVWATPSIKKQASVHKVAPKPTPYKPITGSPLETSLHNFITKLGVTGTELAALMGQCAHESDGFKTTKEYASGAAYEGRKDLGNINPGDGVKYKGRGFIQITGRANYTAAGRALGLDLVNHPELAEQPANAAKVTWWYWKNRVRPNVGVNFDDVKKVTKQINPGLLGLEKRKTATRDFKVAQK